jgi:RNA polymerase sigma-70 factor (ECF subfamily)
VGRAAARGADPYERLETAEATVALQSAIATLPSRQREALVLRDDLGLDADGACALVDVTDGNHRALLHRARASVRAVL